MVPPVPAGNASVDYARNPQDFYIIDGVAVDGEVVRNRIAKQIAEMTSRSAHGASNSSAPAVMPIAQNPGTRQMAGQMAAQMPALMPMQTPIQMPAKMPALMPAQTPIQTPAQMPALMPAQTPVQTCSA